MQHWFVRGVALSACAVFCTTASAQVGGPNDELPQFDIDDTGKSIVVSVEFNGRHAAAVVGSRVEEGRTRARHSAPPLLFCQAADLQNDVLDEFMAWHPLWVFDEREDGHEYLDIVENAPGELVLPMRPDLAELHVLDMGSGVHVLSADLLPATHDYCRGHRTDPDCDGLANRPPQCRLEAPPLLECAGPLTPAVLDASSSSDPDGDALEYRFRGPFVQGEAIGEIAEVDFDGVGSFSIELGVTDEFGDASSCVSSVDVVDTTAPVIDCGAPPSIDVRGKPYTFTVTADDACEGPTSVSLTGFDCHALPPSPPGKGRPPGERRLDRRSACDVALDDQEVVITRAGGVGTIVEWFAESADAFGNTHGVTCSTRVVVPNRGANP